MEQTLLEAILPELREKIASRLGFGDRSVLDPGVIAKGLMVSAVDDGRRPAAWRLAARMLVQSPGMVRHLDFQKGLVKSLPGSAVLERFVKSRGK